MSAGAQADTWADWLVHHDTVSTLGSGDVEFRDGNLDGYYGQFDGNAHLTGDAHRHAGGSCVRMRMEYFDDGKT